MKLSHYTAFAVSAAYAFVAADVMAGAFIGAGESNPDIVLHPSGYVPGQQDLQVNICIDPTSDVTNELVIPVQNVIATFNALQATTGNLGLGNNNNIPSGQLDAESVVLHEVGHCIGLAHVNLATESGVPSADREYTKSTDGANNSFNLNDGADNIRGTSDDIRGDDVNLHYFKTVDNNPFTLAGVIDSSTYSRNLVNLPSGTYAANGSRALAPLLGVSDTEAIMQQGQFVDEAQRSLTADGVATLSYGKAGVDEIAGTSDDYSLTLVYQGITTSNCDVNIVVDNNTGFAQCGVGFQTVSGDHFRISGATVRLNENTNWFYNQVPVGGINMAPSLDPIVDATVNEEGDLSIALNSTDPDTGDTLSLAVTSGPSFCTVADSGDGTGSLNCLPSVGDAGDYLVTVSVSDDGDPVQSASQSFTLSVLPLGIGIISECRTPISAIPDNTGEVLVDSIVINDPRQIVDLDVSMTLSHTFIGDVVASVSRVSSGSSAVLLDRPGVPASTNGCGNDDLDATFDDEGTDGAAEGICNGSSPAISGQVTPTEALDTFDGELINGEWQVTLSDEASIDSGVLFQWCIEATVVEVNDVDSDGDGVFDMQDNCTNVPNAQQTDTNGDGIGNACDADFDNNCTVNFADVSRFVPGFNSQVGDPNYDPDLDADSSGTISFLDFILVTSSFLMEPGPSANACIPVEN
ncbi:MAG: thrombospondin type 3 repeat-containing protein [Gammaproteobacteria bacterium]